LALDPWSVEAQSWLAIALTARVLDGLADSAAADLARAETLAERALAASPRNLLAHTFMDRSRPNTNPYGNPWIRADGLAAFPGWPTSPRIEALRTAWLDTGNLDEQRRICTDLQMQLWQDVPYIPMGEYWQSTAYRKDLVDVMPGCFAVFWGIRRA